MTSKEIQAQAKMNLKKVLALKKGGTHKIMHNDIEYCVMKETEIDFKIVGISKTTNTSGTMWVSSPLGVISYLYGSAIANKLRKRRPGEENGIQNIK